MFATAVAKLSLTLKSALSFGSHTARKFRSWPKRRGLQRNIASLLSINGMRTLLDTARSGSYRDGEIVIVMQSGRKLRIPVAENPRLAKGTPEQLNHIELSPFGIHWPDLDEDLSFRGIAEGDYGQLDLKRSK